MASNHNPPVSLFTQVDITSASQSSHTVTNETETAHLLRQLLEAQDRQNELLEELVQQLGSAQRQRNAELNQWKQSNPRLARDCRLAADTLSRVQTEFLATMTDEIKQNADALLDGEFMLNEFVDRFGPRLAHLNGALQVLTQLSSAPVQPEQTDRS
jgi:hypothetical protein